MWLHAGKKCILIDFNSGVCYNLIKMYSNIQRSAEVLPRVNKMEPRSLQSPEQLQVFFLLLLFLFFKILCKSTNPKTSGKLNVVRKPNFLNNYQIVPTNFISDSLITLKTPDRNTAWFNSFKHYLKGCIQAEKGVLKLTVFGSVVSDLSIVAWLESSRQKAPYDDTVKHE